MLPTHKLRLWLNATQVHRCRLPELPQEEMAPGRWHGASIRAPRRSKSREELKQVSPPDMLASCEGIQIVHSPLRAVPRLILGLAVFLRPASGADMLSCYPPLQPSSILSCIIMDSL